MMVFSINLGGTLLKYANSFSLKIKVSELYYKIL